MGFNLQLTAFSQQPDIEGLRNAGIKGQWRVFAAPDQSAWLMDFSYSAKEPGPAFWDAAAFLTAEKLPPVNELPDLDREMSELLADLAYGAALLSEAANAPCFTCLSNDEAMDAAAIANQGQIVEMAAIHQQNETIDERKYHDRLIAHIFENGEASQEVLTDLVVVDDGKIMYVDEQVIENYHINALSDRMLEKFLRQRIPAFEDNYKDPKDWNWPLLAAHPETPKQGFFGRLFGR
ncbi:MAG: hypothetical protein HRU11_00870 [Parvularculaceae bacterium]|nr:hypothetical protein [Parvularculaceae bacterium]